ncbi:MAG: IS701 family transposase [Phycisphaerae bacterium]
MNVEQILSLGPELADYLDEFGDCFGRSEPRGHMAEYIRGQLSELPRKSVEPIALAAGLVPRTLQEFLRTDVWDQARMRDRVQQIVAGDEREPQSIGILDDSGHPKKGRQTACVNRQYCGRTGKIDNCVVSVHLTFSSFDTTFRAMVDSTPYLPRCWDEDRRRCEQAGIPEEVVYRPKYDIALEQLDQAARNGLSFGWITADIWYSEKPRFIEGLLERPQRFVLEIPRNLACWSCDPGRPPARPVSTAENLCRYSRHVRHQPWTRFHIKDTEKGPMVWEVRAIPVWHECQGRVFGPWWLIHARNVLDPTDEKYFLSNASPGVPLEVLLHVGFARWPIERCLQDEKSKLGLSHFEVRNYQSLCRHLYLTQVSHLFLARQTSRLRGEKSRGHVVPGPPSRERFDRVFATAPRLSTSSPGANGRNPPIPSDAERHSPSLPYSNHHKQTGTTRNQPQQPALQ